MPNAVPGGAGETRRATIAVAAAVAALAAAVTLPGAIDLPLWQDEVASARVLLEPSPAGVVDHVARTESTPPGWYLLAWVGRQAGIPVEGLRFLSVALTAALCALVVVYARRFVPLWTAGAAGALTAFAWQTLFHGSELRAYALLAFLTVLFALLLEQAAARPTAGRLLALGACAAAGAYTHYFFALTAITGLVWLVVEPTARRAAVRAGAAILLGTATLLAWLPGLGDQLGAERFGWIDAFDIRKLLYLPSALFWDPGAMYAADSVDPTAGQAFWRLVLLLLVLGGCIVLAGLGPSARLSMLLVLVPLGVSGIAWAAGLRIITGRNMIGLTAFAAIALAAVVLVLPRRAAYVAAAAGVLVAAGFYVRTPMPVRVDFDRVADALLETGWREGDPILVVGSMTEFRSPLEWYLSGAVTLPEAEEAAPCAEVWVVTDVPAGRELLELSRPIEHAAVGAAEVARVPWSPELAAAAVPRGGSYLDSADGAGCLLPVEDRVL